MLKEKISIYLGILQVICIMTIIIEILIVFMLYRIFKNKVNILWTVSLIRIFLSFISVPFLGHLLFYLISIFDCDHGNAYISKDLPCRGKWYLNHLPSVLITIMLLIRNTIITNLLYFRFPFNSFESDILKKKNSIPDISFSFTKIIINILFVLCKKFENESWITIFLLLFVTGLNAYINLFYSNRINKSLSLFSITLSLITFNGYFTLFFGKILNLLNFNGSIYFYLLSSFITIIFIVYYKKKHIDFALIDFTAINNSYEYLEYILKFFLLVENRKVRNNIIILNNYIFTNEENCPNIDCPLKSYIKNINSGKEYHYLLYNYIEILFKFGISKFKNNNMLKIYYSFFLLEKMNFNQQALIVLNSINEDIYSFQINYYVFKLKKNIDKYSSLNNDFQYQYKTNIKEFKNLILNITRKYYEFWSLLLNNDSNSTENFQALYTIGSQILKSNKEIEYIYSSLINL